MADSGAILLNAGRLSEQKAQQHIIRVLPLLSDARLVLAGGGALEGSYRALAKALAVEDRIHFLGYLPRADVGDLMGAADVFVFPSEWETFSLAVAEAAMLGVPVVCSDLAVLREVLSLDGEPIGRFVASGNQTTLAAAIRRALEPGAAAHALAFAPGLRAKYSETRMLAAYRAMLWPVTGSASSAGGANEMQQD